MVEDGDGGSAPPTVFVDDVKRLVGACRTVTSPKDLLKHCEELFKLLREKKIELGVSLVASECSSACSRAGGKDVFFVQWLRQSFYTFIDLIFEFFSCSEPELQKLGVSFLLRIVKHEAQIYRSTTFPLSAFQLLLARLLQCDDFSTHVQEVLVQSYAAQYSDIRYYVLVVLGKILREFAKQKTGRMPLPSPSKSFNEQEDKAACVKKEERSDYDESNEGRGCEWFVWTKGEAELSKRYTSLLLQLSKSFINDGEMGPFRGKRKSAGAERKADTDDSEDEGKDSDENASRANTYIPNLENSKALQLANHRVAYQNAWIALLMDVEHDKVTTQRLLASVPRWVMPFMSNPLLLSEFFLKAFKNAKQLSICISALSGMFYLLSKHRLGNPDVVHKTGSPSEEASSTNAHFYQRLYRLITPAAFAPRLRVRFLRLLNLSLRSDLLPTCLVASFIKKCSRVACLVSPAATLCLEALVLSLLQKYHATCKSLLSLPDHVSATLRVAGDSFDYGSAKIREGVETFLSSDDELVQDTAEDKNALFELVSTTTPKHLQVSKTDTSCLTRKEARMSLWEIDILRKHALQSVQQLGKMFEADIGNPAAKRICLDDFLDITTGSLLAREFKALNKPSGVVPIPILNAPSTPSDVLHLHRMCVNLARQEAGSTNVTIN